MTGNPKIWVATRYCYGSSFDTVTYHMYEDCFNTRGTDMESRYRSWIYTQFENQRKCKKCQQREDRERQEKERELDTERLKKLNEALEI